MKTHTVLLVTMLGVAGQLAAQPMEQTSQGPLTPRSINVSPYSGQTIRIVAQADSCNASPVGFIIDNVALSGGGSVLNGSFESNLDNWTVDTDGGSCAIYTAGQGDPIGYDGQNPAPTPTAGSVLAASSANSPGMCRLYQDVSLAGVGTLSADMGWTFTQFELDNPGCEVSLRVETTAGALLENLVIFHPVRYANEIPATPLWALGLLTGLIGMMGWRRFKRA